jgi:phosphoglycolate phosphatase-like HAD superfamily hydrolase
MKPRLVLFDLDGTLVQTLAETYKLDCEIIRELSGKTPSLIDYRKNPYRGDWQKFYDAFGVSDFRSALSRFYERLPVDSVKAVPRAELVLKTIKKKGLPTGIVSINKDVDIIMRKLVSAGLDSYFALPQIYIASDSKLDALKNACERQGIAEGDRKTAWFVGDTTNDIKDGKAAGLTTFAVGNSYSFNLRGDLEDSKPAFLLEDILALAAFLRL